MLQVKIEIFDNEDHITRSREFSEEPIWTDLILLFADMVSARYGYNIVDRIKFIGESTSIFDRADGNMIPPAAWAEFLQQDYIQPEFDFNRQDSGHDWS